MQTCEATEFREAGMLDKRGITHPKDTLRTLFALYIPS